MHAPVCQSERHGLLWMAVHKTALKLAIPMALLVLSASTAFAQPAPNTRPAEQPRDREMPRHDDPGFRMPPEPRNHGDYPTSDIHSAVEANARTAYARANYHRLQDSLNIAIRQMQSSFDQSPELMDARKAEQSAWQDYLTARNAALKSVVADPKYQANTALKNNLGEQIAEVRGSYDSQKPSHGRVAELVDQSRMNQLVLLATVKLDYAQVTTDMEVAALKNDSKVADGRTKLMAAGTRVQAIREAFDRSLRGSPELAAIRSRIEDARVAFITAEAFRDGAVEAANEALDYAYYKNRHGGNFTGYEYGYSTSYNNR